MSKEGVSIREVYEIVSRLEGKLDTQLGNMDRKIDSIGNRVTRLEAKISTTSAMVAMIVSVAVSIVVAFIYRK